jgi:hypothetical protein
MAMLGRRPRAALLGRVERLTAKHQELASSPFCSDTGQAGEALFRSQ